MINVRLAFHITDWSAIAGFGNFGVAQVATGFQAGCPTRCDRPAMTNVTASRQAGRRGRLQQISSILGASCELTPFTGKYSLFGKLFSAYDFYLSPGSRPST
jgi:hypothetical protein